MVAGEHVEIEILAALGTLEITGKPEDFRLADDVVSEMKNWTGSND